MTVIGLDLASDPGTAVLVGYKDGAVTFLRELDLSDRASFAGLQIDAVWCEEMDMLP